MFTPAVVITPVPLETAPPRASVSPLDEAWHGKTILDAIAALETVDSYRFQVNALDGHTTGTIVNGVPFSYVLDETPTGGALPQTTTVIGDDRYQSVAGSTWSHEVLSHVSDDGTPIEYGHPFYGRLPGDFGVAGGEIAGGFGGFGGGGELDFYPPFLDAGVVDHNGIESRHIRAIGDGTLTQPESGTIDGPGFLGTIDAWIAVDGGYLIGLRVDGRWVEQHQQPGASGSPLDDPAAAREFGDVTVEGVDDPANVITAPDIPPATPRPKGDPAVLKLITGLPAGAKQLGAHVSRVALTEGNFSSESTTTVAEGPPFRLQTVSAIPNEERQELVVIGDEAWTRSGDEPWTAQTMGDLTWCTADIGTTLSECYAASDAIPNYLAADPVTYVRVAGHETVNGVPSIHIRSTAGVELLGATVPGTADTWIAVDGGWLVRSVFVCDAMQSSIDVTPLDDADVRIDRPVP